jgi:tripartite-type tricarboxylate transporter receptor subunit TctC
VAVPDQQCTTTRNGLSLRKLHNLVCVARRAALHPGHVALSLPDFPILSRRAPAAVTLRPCDRSGREDSMGPLPLLGAIAVAVSLQGIVSAAAQEWPTRPVTLVVPFAPGGGTDVLGRILAPRLSEFLGQQVIIENVGGAGGMNGASRVARAAPDGYQFVLGTAGTHAQNQTLYKNPLYNAAVDFAPVALIVEQPMVLVARKDLRAGDLREFIAYAKTNEAKMQFGSAGAGAASHLACVVLNSAIGINVTHVPYRGSGPAMQDLIAGRIDYQCSTTTNTIPQIEGGLVKPLAILTRSRSPILPALPSAEEQGLPDFEAGTWDAFFLPKGTPAAIVRKLHAATVAAVQTPAVQERLKELGTTVPVPDRQSPQYLQKFVESEIEKWAGPIKASGVRMD